jgi:hypothetical protein
MDLSKLNTLGAVLTVTALSICVLIFVFRLLGYARVEYWLGILLIAMLVPLAYLLFTAKDYQRPPIFYIQIGMMIVFLLIELFVDYIFKLDFRNVSWMIIIYLIFFFGGTGGLIGIASLAGRMWMMVSAGLFLVMTALAMIQRAITGM